MRSWGKSKVLFQQQIKQNCFPSLKCLHSSDGRAQDFKSWGRGFDPRWRCVVFFVPMHHRCFLFKNFRCGYLLGSECLKVWKSFWRGNDHGNQRKFFLLRDIYSSYLKNVSWKKSNCFLKLDTTGTSSWLYRMSVVFFWGVGIGKFFNEKKEARRGHILFFDCCLQYF